MSAVSIVGSGLGSNLEALLLAPDIKPGDAPSYQLCKTILSYHPLGAKMTDSPITKAQSQKREISCAAGPEDRLREAYLEEWQRLGADKQIKNCARLSRAYGISSLALLTEGTPADRPVDWTQLWDAPLAFNVLDPLNTAGSLVLSQDPNSPVFQKTRSIVVNGSRYHPSRFVTMLNEEPIYLEYTQSAFGYVGRSVYQRALFPLKSFLQTMVADDMVAVKIGVLIAKVKQQGSVIGGLAAAVQGVKRAFIQEAVTNNVISIAVEEEIETLNMQNADGPFAISRKHILDNIATAADMPAVMLNQETFAEGFGEGSEDAKTVAQYVDSIREWLDPLYGFFDKVAMFRAWNPDFYKTIQSDFPERYGDKTHQQAFFTWRNSFKAQWPNLLKEPDSELISVEDVKLKAIIALVEVLLPVLDAENRAALIDWAQECFNEIKMLFPSPLMLDIEKLRAHSEELDELDKETRKSQSQPEGGEEQLVKPPPPFSARDSAQSIEQRARVERALADMTSSVGRVVGLDAARRAAVHEAARARMRSRG